MNRQRRTREQWQIIIDRFLRSGLNGSAFCQREGINSKSFYRAKSKLTGSQPTARFIQAKSVSAAAAEVTVQLPGCRIQCSSLVSAEWLARLIKSLNS